MLVDIEVPIQVRNALAHPLVTCDCGSEVRLAPNGRLLPHVPLTGPADGDGLCPCETPPDRPVAILSQALRWWAEDAADEYRACWTARAVGADVLSQLPAGLHPSVVRAVLTVIVRRHEASRRLYSDVMGHNPAYCVGEAEITAVMMGQAKPEDLGL